MNEYVFECANHSIQVYSLNTIVVGTGAAGFNAAGRIHQLGQTDVAIVTNHINAGTSRNTGSDKQTYYKLSLGGEAKDSPISMAKELFAGGCVDGEHALCEAALSVRSFYNLVELGVPFPNTRYGEYIGYKTDHDPCERGSSVGPYTSKMMTESLQKNCESRNIKIFDKMQVIGILQDNGVSCGVLCLNLESQDNNKRFTAFHCKNIVYATGGPAVMYANNVYPHGHYGSSGIAFEAGVIGKNLTEWQYGLASIKPRWNVSGTYMQALPRFISTDVDGNDEKEFLLDFFGDDTADMLLKVFLKGYQWPFDVRKIESGSSIIDILVYLETCKGRRVFLDFTKNTLDKPIEFDKLGEEVLEYLSKAEACFGTPIERLLHMNKPAVDFYKDKGVDISSEPLEIILCAQHNNGGLSIDKWWQTNINGLFAVGEVAASHGIYRPGGSALNAGQVGSLRAAQFIANQTDATLPTKDTFEKSLSSSVANAVGMIDSIFKDGQESNLASINDDSATDMSLYAGPIRNKEDIIKTKEKVVKLLADFNNNVKIGKSSDLYKMFRLKDMLISQLMYLNSMIDYIEKGGKSRGSALYTDMQGNKPFDTLPDTFTFLLEDGSLTTKLQEIAYKNNDVSISWRDVNPIPSDDNFFENVWRSFRENNNVY